MILIFLLAIAFASVSCLVKRSTIPQNGHIISLNSIPSIKSFRNNDTIQLPFATASGGIRIHLAPHTELFEGSLPPGTFFKGHVIGYEFESTARFHVVNQHIEGLFSVPENGTDKYFFVDGVEDDSGRVNHLVIYNELPHQHDISCGCNATMSNAASMLNFPKLKRRQAGRKSCQVAVLADSSFAAQNGAQTENLMFQIMNTVSGIYQRTFQVTLTVRSVQNSGQANYGGGPSRSLDSFAADVRRGRFGFRNQDVCVAHMFVARSDWGRTAGIAYVGTVCRGNNVGISTNRIGGRTQSTSSLVLTVAHEIGHNFGAGHSPDQSSIMAASGSSSTPRFASGSIQQISRNLGGRCFDSGGGGPPSGQPRPSPDDPKTGRPNNPNRPRDGEQPERPNNPEQPPPERRPEVPTRPRRPPRSSPNNPETGCPNNPNRPQDHGQPERPENPEQPESERRPEVPTHP
ncbi:hypothetical protein BKA69DRAFT_1165838 [Paraphysoderma sedebokerense]|nr:hypothetical protein BKA69DRAFT_1165838 [Paraphysoderma sedebokerense]